MVSEGVLLMAVGMATVFAFLGLLVGLMQGSAAFFAAFGDRFTEPEPGPAGLGAAAAGAGGNDDEIAIVLAAIEAHRRGGAGA